MGRKVQLDLQKTGGPQYTLLAPIEGLLLRFNICLAANYDHLCDNYDHYMILEV